MIYSPKFVLILVILVLIGAGMVVIGMRQIIYGRKSENIGLFLVLFGLLWALHAPLVLITWW
jgi:hypothetical protein